MDSFLATLTDMYDLQYNNLTRRFFKKSDALYSNCFRYNEDDESITYGLVLTGIDKKDVEVKIINDDTLFAEIKNGSQYVISLNSKLDLDNYVAELKCGLLTVKFPKIKKTKILNLK